MRTMAVRRNEGVLWWRAVENRAGLLGHVFDIVASENLCRLTLAQAGNPQEEGFQRIERNDNSIAINKISSIPIPTYDKLHATVPSSLTDKLPMKYFTHEYYSRDRCFMNHCSYSFHNESQVLCSSTPRALSVGCSDTFPLTQKS